MECREGSQTGPSLMTNAEFPSGSFQASEIGSTRQEDVEGTLPEQISALRRRTTDLEIELGEREADRAALEAQVGDARSHPFRHCKTLLLHKLFTLLSKASPPLPAKAVTGLARRAEKRDPKQAVLRSHLTPLRARSSLAPWVQDAGSRVNDNAQEAPRISIVMVVNDAPGGHLLEAIESVVFQGWRNWELCICDNASGRREALDVLDSYRGVDWRIRIVRASEKLEIADATTLAVDYATGRFIAFLVPNVRLETDALSDIVSLLRDDPEAECIRDGKAFHRIEDAFDHDSSSGLEHLQPILTASDFTCIRKSRYLALAGLRPIPTVRQTNRAAPSPQVYHQDNDKAIEGIAGQSLPGVNFIGPVEVLNGLGESARGYMEAFRASGVPLNVIPWRRGFKRQLTMDIPLPSTSTSQPINVIHLNLDTLANALPKLGDIVTSERYNIAICYWELAVLRPEWQGVLNKLDEIWVPSSFMQASFSACFRGPVRLVRPALLCPEKDVHGHRNALGLRPDSYVFYYAFDASSFIDRKNPHALIQAFQEEFGAGENVQLLIKTHHSDPAREGVRILPGNLQDSENIVVVDRRLDRTEMQGLWACIDAYVSPHRSEGLGLTVIEALLTEKPVIATPYGGVGDFVLPETALPLDYTLTEIAKTVGPYPEGYIWANPGISSLRQSMRKLFEDRTFGKTLAKAGCAHASCLFSKENTGSLIRDEVGRIGSALVRKECP